MASSTPSVPIWIDAQLPPALARWLRELGESGAAHVSELGLLSAEDSEIFQRARQAEALVITKDSDFVQFQERYGSPPRILWVTCGNRSNRFLRDLMSRNWTRVKELLEAGEVLIEMNEIREPRS